MSKRKEIEITMGVGEQILASRYLEGLLNKQLPGHTLYWLHRIINKIQSEMRDTGYFDKKQEIIAKYSIGKTEDGQEKIDTNRIPDLQKELSQYQQDPLKLSGIYQLQIDPDNQDIKDAKLTGHDWSILMHLCEELEQ